MFLTVAIMMTVLLSFYWLLHLKPELNAMALSNATAIAQSQAHMIEDVLSIQGDDKRVEKLQSTVNKILLLNDSNLHQPFTLGIILELDLDVVNVPDHLMELRVGKTVCGQCILSDIPLFSRHSKELLGIASFYMNDAPYQFLVTSIRNQLTIGAVVLIGLVFICWRIIRSLVHPLWELAYSLQGQKYAESDSKDLVEVKHIHAKSELIKQYSPDTRLSGFVSEEILFVKQAIDGMFAANNRQLKELVDARKYTESIIESMREILLVIDTEGAIESVNDYAAKALGYTKKALVGKQVNEVLLHDIVTSSDSTSVNGSQFTQAAEIPHIEAKMLRKNGSELTVLLSYAQRRSGLNKSSEVVCVAKDISDLMKAEESLYLTQACVDQAAEAVFWVDKQANIFFVNTSACESLGYSKSELLLLKVFDISPEVTNELWSDFWDERRSKGSDLFESVHRRKDGSEFETEVETNYLAYKDSEMMHVYVRDISERKKTEWAIRNLNENLESRVEERTAELKSVQLELVKRERLATLGQLTAIVSHELRNPLGSIRSSTYTIAMKLKDKGLGVEKALDRIERSIIRCDNIIGELLEYTRNQPLSLRCIDFDLWLSELLEELLLPNGIQLVHKSNAPGKVNLDPDRFRRVIINLFDNAIQAIQEQDDSNVSENYLMISTSKLNGKLELVIEDTGVGIDAEGLSKVFEPLYSTKGFGAGLGLSIVKQIVEQHGGNIEVSSAPGRGARFEIGLFTG